MNIYSFFKKACIVLLLPLLFGCGGDVDTYPSNPTPNISLSSSYDFGGVVVNNSSDKTFTITNTGNEPLSIGSISYPDPPFFILADNCFNTTLGVNKTCSVSVRFSPLNQADYDDYLISIPSNDPGGTVTIGLTGEGYGLNVWINKIEAVGCLVTVDVTVTSPLVDLALNPLTEGDFQLYENGQAIPAIVLSQVVIPSPVSVVLAIDWSGSVEQVINEIRTAAESFINNLDIDSDEAAACKFGSAIDFDPPGLNDPLFYPGTETDWSSLIAYIWDDFSYQASTKLYDAVYDSITRAAKGTKETKAVVVLSDGVNTAGVHTLADVIAYANNEDKKIPVFTIYYTDPLYKGGGYGNPEVMEQLAEGTGGKYYDGTVVDLASVYQQISNILTSKYVITYTSSNCTGDVPLDVLADYTDPLEGHLYGQESGTITFP